MLLLTLHKAKIRPITIRKQTLANCERYITPELPARSEEEVP